MALLFCHTPRGSAGSCSAISPPLRQTAELRSADGIPPAALCSAPEPGGIRIGTLLERDGNADRAVGAAGGRKVEQVIQSGELLLNHRVTLFSGVSRRGPGAGGGDFIAGGATSGYWATDRQGADSQNPGEHNQNGDNLKGRPGVAQRSGKTSGVASVILTSAALTCWPGATFAGPFDNQPVAALQTVNDQPFVAVGFAGFHALRCSTLLLASTTSAVASPLASRVMPCCGARIASFIMPSSMRARTNIPGSSTCCPD